MRPVLLCLMVLAAAPLHAGNDPASRFIHGFASPRSVEPALQKAVIARIDAEARLISNVILGGEIVDGIKLSVRWSDLNPNGFETHFECHRSLEAALGPESFAELHAVFSLRYQELVARPVSGQKASDPGFRPLTDFLERHCRKPDKTLARRS